MRPHRLTAALKEEAIRLGFDLAAATPAVTPPTLEHLHRWLADGWAGQMRYLVDRAAACRHPRYVLRGVKSLLMLAMNYRSVEPRRAEAGQGAISRYAWGTDYHELLRERLRRLADFHRRLTQAAGVRGVVDTAPLLERQFAQLAGLGWIGKNTLLINEQYGSWLFLAALLTTEELESDGPSQAARCGSCRACLEACPTGALVEPYRLDARKCISYLTVELREHVPAERRGSLGQRVFGCDACQEACPWNRRTPRTRQAEFEPRAGMNPADLVELFALDEPGFGERFRHTSLWRAKRRGVLRNAALALGNHPVSEARPALLRGLSDAEPLVRAASAWALARVAERTAEGALRERLAVESDPRVRSEIQASLNSP